MFFQLGIGAVLEGHLAYTFGIHLDSQPERNRELARIGSETGLFSTIDLSSASDSMSLKMLEVFLPRNVLAWLKCFRSPLATIGDESIELNMISTMGNGFTFPLQTIFFSCIVSAAAKSRGFKLFQSLEDKRRYSGNYGVFGDDIICHKLITRDVLRLLEITGFKVNADKTFIEGPFRESCGYDYFSGHNVRGVYVKTLKGQNSRYALINNLNIWSARHGITLSSTQKYLLSTVRYQPIPPLENEDAGIRVPLSMVSKLKMDKHCQSIKYRVDRARPSKLLIKGDRILVPTKEKKRLYNPSGLLISFLQGSIVSCTITIRHDRTLYATKWNVTPNWDYVPSTSLLSSRELWRRWKSAVYINFY